MNKGVTAILLVIIAIVIITALWSSIVLMMKKSSRRSAISLKRNSKIESNTAEYLIQKSSCSNLGKTSLFLPSLWSLKGMNMTMGKHMKIRFNNISGNCNKTIVCIYQENNNIMVSYWSSKNNEYLVVSVLPISGSNNTILNIENCKLNISVMNMSKKANKQNKNSESSKTSSSSSQSSSSQSGSSSQTSTTTNTNTVNQAQEEYEEALKSCENLGGVLINKSTIQQDIFNYGQFFAEYPYVIWGFCDLGPIYITSIGSSCANVKYFCQSTYNNELYYWDSSTKSFELASYSNTYCTADGYLVYATLECTPGQTCSFSCGSSFFFDWFGQPIFY